MLLTSSLYLTMVPVDSLLAQSSPATAMAISSLIHIVCHCCHHSKSYDFSHMCHSRNPLPLSICTVQSQFTYTICGCHHIAPCKAELGQLSLASLAPHTQLIPHLLSTSTNNTFQSSRNVGPIIRLASNRQSDRT